MKNSFSELLSEIISQSEISKNEMIRACDIDRSSFFKFLNGSRIPTAEQLNRICSKLQFSPQEEKTLRMEYARVTRGEQNVRTGNRIADLLWKLEKGISYVPRERDAANSPQIAGQGVTALWGREEVLQGIAELIENAAQTGEVGIDLFLPPLEEEFSKELLELLCSPPGKHVRVRHLIELPSRSICVERSALDQLLVALLCSAAVPGSYTGYYYYGYQPAGASVGVLYPYSVILETEVVLLSSGMDSALIVRDELFCENCRERFINELNSARRLVRKVREEEIVDKMIAPIRFRYGSNKYPDDPFREGHVIYVSPSGIKEFVRTGRYVGAPDAEAKNLSERIVLIREAKKKIGSKIFLIDERNMPQARTWNLVLAGKEMVVLYKKGCPYCFVVTESGIVQDFYSFMEELPGSGNLLRNDLAAEFLDEVLTRLVRMTDESKRIK